MFLSQNLSDLKASSHSNMNRLICILKSQVMYQSRSYSDSSNCMRDRLAPSTLAQMYFFHESIRKGWTCQRQVLRYSFEVALKLKLATVLCGDEVCNVTSDRIQFCERVKYFIGLNRYWAEDCVTMNRWDVGEEGLRWSLNFHLFIAVTCTNLTAGESSQLFCSQSQ